MVAKRSQGSISIPTLNYPPSSLVLPRTRVGGFTIDGSSSEMSAVSGGGCNLITVTCQYNQPTWTSPTIGNSKYSGYTSGIDTVTDAAICSDLQAQFYSIHQLGCLAGYKPLIEYGGPGTSPDSGSFSSSYRAPADPGISGAAQWFNEYTTRLMVPYCTNSNSAYLPDIVFIETELNTCTATLAYINYWYEMISAMRATGWKGIVATSDQFGNYGSDVYPFYSYVDWIGADAYYSLADNYTDQIAVFQGTVPYMQSAYNTTGKGMWFGELGIAGFPTTTDAQNEYFINAFWEVFGPLSFFMGVSWWSLNSGGANPTPSLVSSMAAGLTAYPPRTPTVAIY